MLIKAVIRIIKFGENVTKHCQLSEIHWVSFCCKQVLLCSAETMRADTCCSPTHRQMFVFIKIHLSKLFTNSTADIFYHKGLRLKHLNYLTSINECKLKSCSVKSLSVCVYFCPSLSSLFVHQSEWTVRGGVPVHLWWFG